METLIHNHIDQRIVQDENENAVFTASFNHQAKEIVHRYNLHPQLLEVLEELHAASLDNDQERMYQARADAREIIALATGSEVAE